MSIIDRRGFLSMLAAAAAALATRGAGAGGRDLYAVPAFGNLRLLHITDSHGQLLPLYFREPHLNLGIGPEAGRFPHLVGQALLGKAGLSGDRRLAHAFTHLDFEAAAREFGKVGGYAHLRTLIERLRADYPGGRASTLLLDGGDTWQGSATALLSSGMDMVRASNLLGVDVMTGHWEFTWGEAALRRNLAEFRGTFVAQNVLVREEALFDGAAVHDEATGHVFPPFALRQAGGATVAIVGQAFPYTPIANPARFVPDWRFGINEEALQQLVEGLRGQGVDVVVLLSHNGMDVDLKLASRVRGIDVILGGHTHDAVPLVVEVPNAGGRTLVTSAGCSGKFVGVLDLEVRGGVRGYRYALLPVFSDLIAPDAEMAALIAAERRPHEARLAEALAVTESLLYRRGNLAGTFDQLLCEALRAVHDTPIGFSPGFRWGGTLLPGDTITWEDLLDHTAISYPGTWVREMTGAEIRAMLEDVADNLFNPDPYYRQGGDMVRSSGLRYTLDPFAPAGKRISALSLADGTRLDPERRYRVAGWAATGTIAEGPPVWELVAEYLRDRRTVRVDVVENPVVRGIEGNPGAA